MCLQAAQAVTRAPIISNRVRTYEEIRKDVLTVHHVQQAQQLEDLRGVVSNVEVMPSRLEGALSELAHNEVAICDEGLVSPVF